LLDRLSGIVTMVLSPFIILLAQTDKNVAVCLSYDNYRVGQ